MLLCQGKAGDGKQRLWVVPFLWTPRTHCKVCWQEKSSFFSTQPALLLSSLLSVLSLVCGSLWNCPHTYWRGFWGIHQCAPFSSSLPSSPYLHSSVNLSLLFSLPVCLHLSKKYFCIPLFNFCFSHSPPPAHSDAAPPRFLTSLIHPNFSLANFFYFLFFAFCFVDYNSCVHPSKPPYLSSTLNLAPRSKCLFQYMSLSLQVYLLCTFQTLSLWSFQAIFLRLSPLCSKFPPVYKVIIYFCFSKSYLAFSSFPFLLSCSIVPASLSYAACPSLYLYVMPYLNILLHRVPLLSPSVLVCFLSISIVLTLSPPPSYSFGVWPLLPLLLCTHFRLKYIYVYTLSVYSPLF